MDEMNFDKYSVFTAKKELYKEMFTLIIHNVNQSDFGIYICFANNSFGSHEDSVNVVGKSNHKCFSSHPHVAARLNPFSF